MSKVLNFPNLPPRSEPGPEKEGKLLFLVPKKKNSSGGQPPRSSGKGYAEVPINAAWADAFTVASMIGIETLIVPVENVPPEEPPPPMTA